MIGRRTYTLTSTNLTALRKLAMGGDEYSQFDLGLIYYSQREFTNAFEQVLKAAKQGHRRAEYLMSTLYSAGTGVAQDEKEARFWLERAARLPSTEAMVDLANALLRSPSGRADSDLYNALQMLRTAAWFGDSNAASICLSTLRRLPDDQWRVENIISCSCRLSSENSNILEGLRSIYVGTSNPDKNAEDDGFTEERIQRTVELRLRTAGIKVGGGPVFHVTPTCIKSGDTYFVSIRAELRATVDYRLKTLHVPIWSMERRGIYGTLRIPSAIRLVEDLTDEFANQYLAANPK